MTDLERVAMNYIAAYRALHEIVVSAPPDIKAELAEHERVAHEELIHWQPLRNTASAREARIDD